MYLACYAYELVFLVLRFKNNRRKLVVNNIVTIQRICIAKGSM